MSLKAFHIFFIAVATLICTVFGVWAVRDFRGTGNGANLAMGIMSFVCGVGLVWYGRWFLRKLKGVSYI
jgi:hypothetical protein